MVDETNSNVKEDLQNQEKSSLTSFAQILFEYVSPLLAVIVLNTTEIYMILRQKIKIKHSAIAYVFNLAISDIFVGVVIVIAKISYYIWKYTNSRTAWVILNVSRYYLRQ